MALHMFPFVPASRLCRTRYDNLARLRRYRGPLSVAHGTPRDRSPHAHGERLFAAAPSERKQFASVPEGTHGGISGTFYADVQAFLQQTPAAKYQPEG